MTRPEDGGDNLILRYLREIDRKLDVLTERVDTLTERVSAGALTGGIHG
jgi:hypothetical protein